MTGMIGRQDDRMIVCLGTTRTILNRTKNDRTILNRTINRTRLPLAGQIWTTTMMPKVPKSGEGIGGEECAGHSSTSRDGVAGCFTSNSSSHSAPRAPRRRQRKSTKLKYWKKRNPHPCRHPRLINNEDSVPHPCPNQEPTSTTTLITTSTTMVPHAKSMLWSITRPKS